MGTIIYCRGSKSNPQGVINELQKHLCPVLPIDTESLQGGNEKAYYFFQKKDSRYVLRSAVPESISGYLLETMGQEIKLPAWRANKGCTYYFVASDMTVQSAADFDDKLAEAHYEKGNYFQTRAEAGEMCSKLIKCLHEGRN